MQYARLGKSGLVVSRLCLGCVTYGDPAVGKHPWSYGDVESRPFFRRALDLGINYFDTANFYGLGASEEVLGRAIRDLTKRESVVIATKVSFPMRDEPNGKGLSRKAVLHEIDASLRRLATDYVDLYQVHSWDDETPFDETLEALHDIAKAGKARYLGASSYRAWQLGKALYAADLLHGPRFVSIQNQYNLVQREDEREMLPLCKAEGIGVVPWSPLARGRLARDADAQPETRRAQLDPRRAAAAGPKGREMATHRAVSARVGEIARARGVSRSCVALAWLLHQPAVTAPIVGATKLEHLDDAAAATSFELSPNELAALEEPYAPQLPDYGDR